MRPIQGTRGVAVFDRVVVDVIHAALVVRFATHELLPIATLPDAAFTFALAALRASFVLGKTA